MADTSTPRRLEYVALDELASALLNPKDHDAQLIEDSIGRFGFLEIPVLDERTGRLIAGHGRRDQLMALRARGEPAPEGITVADDGTWLVPTVRGWSSASDDEAHAAGIAINRGAEAGGWQIPVLYDILSSFSETDDGLVGLGFDVHELDDMVADLAVDTASFGEESTWVGTTGSHAIPTLDEKAERYAAKGVRSLILDYPIQEFDTLVADCARLRAAYEQDTNAQLVAWLIHREAATVPADDEGPLGMATPTGP